MILGIDIGNKYTTISTIKNGNVDVILDGYSKRRFSSLVYVNDNCKRIIGNEVNNRFISLYKNTISNIKYSMKYEDNKFNEIPLHQTLTGLINYCVSLSNFSDKGNIVLTYPAYFTEKEKQIYLDVAKITNLNISLYDEPTSISSYYGFFNCCNLEENEEKNVIFIDIGDINTTIFHSTFNNKSCKINYVECCKLGGLYIDQKLYRYFANKIKTNKGIDIFKPEYIKASIKLFRECEKIKKNLSLSNQVNQTIECLLNDDDYTLKLTRTEFEEIISTDINELLNLISNNKFEKIDSIEILGACSRIPIFKETIKNYFEKDLSWTLNTEETVSKGATILAAHNADFVKMKSYDITSYLPDSNKTELTYFNGEKNLILCDNKTVYELDIDKELLTIIDEKEKKKKFNPLVLESSNKKWSILSKKIINNKVWIETEYVNGILEINKAFTKENETNDIVSLKVKLKENKLELNDDIVKKIKETEIKIIQRNEYLNKLEEKINDVENTILDIMNNLDTQNIEQDKKEELLNYFDKILDNTNKYDLNKLNNISKEITEKISIIQ